MRLNNDFLQYYFNILFIVLIDQCPKFDKVIGGKYKVIVTLAFNRDAPYPRIGRTDTIENRKYILKIITLRHNKIEINEEEPEPEPQPVPQMREYELYIYESPESQGGGRRAAGAFDY
ncbi:MAG: hypothetical protein EZS28_004369 [Streblomastix strix]|uniref:Uncharacterized protein n=1 Tax=Streblomastix strix TaxID=222440 RepID=A0A5J4WYC5_9EUKA|nr:MAG: hypothetical protein EZS28_004369 [Streblomastix strix]